VPGLICHPCSRPHGEVRRATTERLYSVFMTGEAETARITYESSRAEILERIRLRDAALLGYLAAAAAIFGVAATNANGFDVLFVLPFLSLAAALLVCQHDWTVAAICWFITEEIPPFLAEKGAGAPSWEFSATLHKQSFNVISSRTASHFLLIDSPAVFALVWLKQKGGVSGLLDDVAWKYGIFAVFLSVGVIVGTHFQRHSLYKRTSWRGKDGHASPIIDTEKLDS
jgi:hypothetical protein